MLRDVGLQDAGVYTCLACNAGGRVLCKAELLVESGESATLLAPGQTPRDSGYWMATLVPTDHRGRCTGPGETELSEEAALLLRGQGGDWKVSP